MVSRNRDGDSEIRSTFRALSTAGEPLTASEVAETVGCSRRRVTIRLDTLVDRGCLKTKRVGATERVWWESSADEADRRGDGTDTGSGVAVSTGAAPGQNRRERDRERDKRIMDSLPVGRFRTTPGAEGTFVDGNEKLASMYGADSMEELSRHSVSELYADPARRDRFSQRLTAEGTVEDFELEQVRLDGEPLRVSVTALLTREDGQAYFEGIVRDITDQRKRKQELKRDEALLKQSQDVNAVIDPTGSFQYLTPSTEHVLGYEPMELVSENAFEYIHPDDREEIWEEFAAVIDDPDYDPLVEFRFRHADGSWVVLEAQARNLLDDPDVHGIVAYTRDVTEHRKRERKLEESRQRYRTLAENVPNGGVAMVDQDLRYVTVGGTSLVEPDVAPSQLEGTHIETNISAELAELLIPRYEAALDGETTSVEHQCGETTYRIRFVPVRDDNGDVFAAIGLSQDVTAQVRYERELEVKARQQQVNADLGQRALGTTDLDDLFDDAVERVAETLHTDYCRILDLEADRNQLRFRSGTGWADEYVGTETVSSERDSQAGFTLLVEEPVIVEDMQAETRFTGADLAVDPAIESGISVVIGSLDDPWGVLEVHDVERDEFSENDALFVQAVANTLATAIERRGREWELEEQHEHLAALNNINSVVRDVNEAIVDQSTREEIEQVVCRRLANSSSYTFAWIAGIDPRTDSLDVHVEVGVDDYPDAASVSIDPDQPAGDEPIGRATRSREMQFTNDVRTDPALEPLREVAEELGYRSFAAIPICYQETLYGVLGLFTERVGAFADQEGEVVSQLGDIVGHAITAVERKQALMSDEVVEVDFRMENVLDGVGIPDEMSGRIEFDETVAIDGGIFLQYGTAADGAIETVETIVDVVPFWETVSVLGEGSDVVRFELRLSEPPVVSAVASSGGYIDEAVVEDGDMHLSIHLPTTVDVRRLVDMIQDAYPMAEMVTRRQVTRSDSRDRIERALIEELTDRQRTALEASFHAGFFDWPRESSGEDVADSLGVSGPTFHQHLRKAQQKLFDALLT